MVFTKIREKIELSLVFIFFIIFPLGQLIRIPLGKITIHPIDVVVFSSALLFATGKNKNYPRYHLSILWFLGVLIFSFILFLDTTNLYPYLTGLSYLIRLVSYIYYYFSILHVTRNNSLKGLFTNLLLVAGISVAIFGWLQYIFLPDLRFLKLLGWDDHYFRLVSTYLDPTFTGIIFVFSLLLAMEKYFSRFERKYLLIFIFLLVSLAFTYSRSSYLAFFLASYLFFKLHNKIKFYILSLLLLASLVLLLPRPPSEGVKLERTHSIYQKFENYSETLKIISKYPLFGIGFNNLCLARQEIIGERNPASHSCSGSDSSILLVWATSGTIGILIFLGLVKDFVKHFLKDFLLLSTIGALFAHSLFANSLFYPWVMGWLVILTALRADK